MRKPSRLDDDDDDDDADADDTVRDKKRSKAGKNAVADDDDHVEAAAGNADEDEEDGEDNEEAGDGDGGDDDDGDEDELLNWAEGRRRQRAASAKRRKKKRVRRDTSVRVADAGARLTAAAVCALDAAAQWPDSVRWAKGDVLACMAGARIALTDFSALADRCDDRQPLQHGDGASTSSSSSSSLSSQPHFSSARIDQADTSIFCAATPFAPYLGDLLYGGSLGHCGIHSSGTALIYVSNK